MGYNPSHTLPKVFFFLHRSLPRPYFIGHALINAKKKNMCVSGYMGKKIETVGRLLSFFYFFL